MGEYLDLQSEALAALEIRQARRRRLIAGIRGWLRKERHPRLAAGALFAGSAVGGGVVAGTAWAAGLSPWGAAPALGVLAMWPVFVGLIGWQASRFFQEWARGDQSGEFLRRVEAFVADDELAESEERHHLFDEKPETEAQRGWQAGVRGGIQGGSQGGGMALPVLLIVGLLTLGTLVVWEMIRRSPTIFAETILDASIARARPGMEGRVTLEDWRQNAVAGTAMYFGCLAVVAALLGGVIRCLW